MVKLPDWVKVSFVGYSGRKCSFDGQKEQCFLSLSLQVLLYHNYDYTAPENLGRDVLLGQVSPLFHTAKEQCPDGRGIERKILQAAEDDKEGEPEKDEITFILLQTLGWGLGLLVEC